MGASSVSKGRADGARIDFSLTSRAEKQAWYDQILAAYTTLCERAPYDEAEVYARQPNAARVDLDVLADAAKLPVNIVDYVLTSRGWTFTRSVTKPQWDAATLTREELMVEYATVSEAASELGINPSSIYAAIRGQVVTPIVVRGITMIPRAHFGRLAPLRTPHSG